MTGFLKKLTLLSLLGSATAFGAVGDLPIMNPKQDMDVTISVKNAAGVTEVMRVDASSSTVIVTNGLVTKDVQTDDMTVNAAESIIRVNWAVPSGVTVTNNGTIYTIGEVVGQGTIIGTGSIISLDAGQNADDVVFGGNVQIIGNLTGGSPLKVTGGMTVDGTTTFAGGVEFDEAVGIGTTLPEGQLHLAKAVSGSLGPILVLDNNVGGATGTATEITLLTDVNGSQAGIANARIKAINTNGGSGSTELRFINYNGSSEITSLLIQDNGDTVLTVQDDGATTCPDGGNVCSGLTALVCTPGANTAACSGQMIWQRVGNVVTGSINGAAAATGAGQILFTFSSLPHMAASGNFAVQDVAGTCVHHAAGSLAETATGSMIAIGGTKTVLVDFEIVAHPFTRFMLCSFSYRLP